MDCHSQIERVWQKTRVPHLQWCSLSFTTVPGTEAAPIHELHAGTGSLTFFRAEKWIWVHTFLWLLSLASGATAQKSSSFSQVCISREALFQQDPFLYAERQPPAIRAAVEAFRGVRVLLFCPKILTWLGGYSITMPYSYKCKRNVNAFCSSPWFWEYKIPGEHSAVTLSAVEICKLVMGTCCKSYHDKKIHPGFK